MQFDQFKQFVDDGVTTAGRMAVALTLVRTRNNRVKAGTASPSPIYGGMDPETVRARRVKSRAARRARAAHRRARK